MSIVWVGGEVALPVAAAVCIAIAVAVTITAVFELAKGEVRDPGRVGVAGKDDGVVDVVEGHVADEPVSIGRVAVPLVKVSKRRQNREEALSPSLSSLLVLLLLLLLLLLLNRRNVQRSMNSTLVQGCILTLVCL